MKTPPLFLIESFLAFAQSKNMQDAAQHLQISQPALTNHLQQFAACFSQRVFDQLGRKKVLTSFGLQLNDLLAQRFANLDQQIKSLNDHFLDPSEASVTIAGRAELLASGAATIAFPGTLIFQDMDGATAAQGVLDRKYEIALSNHTAKADEHFSKRLFSDHFSLFVPKKWLSPSQKKESLAKILLHLSTHPLLSYKLQDENLQTLWAHAKIKNNPSPHRVLSHWPALIKMVNEERGWTLAPSRYKADKETFTLNIPTSLLPQNHFYILYRKESWALPWFRHLTQELQRVFETE